MKKLFKFKPSILLTAVIFVFLSASPTAKAALYINGPLLGSGRTVNDYETSKVAQFSEADGYYYYNFYGTGSADKFSISESAGVSLDSWKTNSFYSETDWSADKFYIRKEYPLVKGIKSGAKNHDFRAIYLGGSYNPIAGKEYCIIVKRGTNPVMFVQEGFYKSGCTDHIFINGDFNVIGTGTTLDPIYEFMQYDPDANEYFYTSVGNSGNITGPSKTFTLYNSTKSNKLDASPTSLSVNTHYLLSQVGTGTTSYMYLGSTSASSVTIHVSRDLSQMWITENLADGTPKPTNTLYLCFGDTYNGTSPDVTLTSTDGVYTYYTNDLESELIVNVSTTKGYSGDSDKMSGFNYGKLKFGKYNFNPGESSYIAPVLGNSSIVLKKGYSGKLVIDTNEGTVKYDADAQKNLYINGPLVNGTTNDYMLSDVDKFEYDAVHGYYYYEVEGTETGSGGTAKKFTISTKAGNGAYASAADWTRFALSSSTDGGQYFIRKEYTLSNSKTEKTISLGGGFTLQSGKTYTFIVEDDFSKFYVIEGGYDYRKCRHLFINGTFNVIGTDEYEFMQYDPTNDEYFYTAMNSAKINGSSYKFSVYKSDYSKKIGINPWLMNKDIHYVTKNFNTSYEDAYQYLSTSAPTVTIHVSGDESLMWFTENDANGDPVASNKLYLCTSESNDGRSPIEMLGTGGVYTYSLGHIANPKNIRISTTFGYENDRSDNTPDGTDYMNAGFNHGLLKFSEESLNPGGSADIVSGAGLYSVSSEYITLQPGFNARLEIDLNNGTITYYANAELTLYITGPVTGNNFTIRESETTYKMSSYNESNVDEFIFEDNVFHYTFTAATTKYNTYDISNSFTMSTALGSYSDWDQGGYRTDRTTYGTDINAGRKYPLITEEAVRFIKKSDGTALTNGQKYTIYVYRDFSKIWVEEGEYSPAVATARDIYLKGSGVGNANGYSYDAVSPWRFQYDAEHEYYYLKVPRNTVNATKSGNKITLNSFQIATDYGSSAIWNANSILITNPHDAEGDGHTHIPASDSKEVRMGFKYKITVGSSSSSNTLADFVMHDYHANTAYTFYISKDLTQMWVQPDIFVIGWMTGGYNGYRDPEVDSSSTIKQLVFDPDLERYVHTFAGSSASVFELSTAVSGYNSNNYYFGPTADWYDGMLCYVTYTNGVKNDQPDIASVPRTAYIDADLTLPENAARCYPITEGWAISTDSGDQYNLKNDHTILGYNPNYLYRVNVSADLKQMWITEQPINMPLGGRDFYDDAYNPVPHYFLVGSRTADWRLLPEWEIKTNGTANPTSGTLSGRFMYDGYFAIAKVPSYMDYIHHRYEVFSNSLASQQNYTSTASPITLTSYGNSSALHYTADDPVHNEHNSITWNLDPEDHSEAGIPTEDMMRLSVPFRISNLNLTINGSGNPTSVSFAGSSDPEVINRYRTFTLVGEHINYEGKFDFDNAYGKCDLREMSSTYKTVKEKNWANSWISFDKYANPYYDAFGNTLYKTAYDIDWARNHDVYFDINVGGKDLIINSQNYRFTLADNFTEAELAADPYRNLYQVHPRLSNTTPNAGASRQIGNGATGQLLTNAENAGEVPTKQYTELLVTDYTAEGDAKYGTWGSTYQSMKPNGSYETLNSDWRCYVIKDVWLKGDFKAWTGWGGNLIDREGWTAPNANPDSEDMRWYFGNFGHSQEGTPYVVKGFDPLAGNDPSYKIDVYQTYRDVKNANFRTFGYDPDDENSSMQYYNRVILWYNANTGSRKNAAEPNAVLQLVQSSAQPNIRAYHKPGTSNYLDTEWTLVDHTESHVYDDYDVVSYQIIRYRVLTDENGNEYGEPYRTFNAVPLYDTKVADLIPETGIIQFSDPYALGQGSYYYELFVTIEDPDVENSQIVLTATSNIVPINAAAKPVLMEADQIKSVDSNGEPIYSFDLRVKTYTNEDADIYDYTSHYSYNVVEDLEYLEISVDKHTADALNRQSCYIENRDNIKITSPTLLKRKNDEATFISSYTDENGEPCVGFVLSEETGYDYTSDGVTTRYPYFVPMNDGSGRYHIVFNFINRYQKNNTGDHLRYFAFGWQLQQWIEFPIIRWIDVMPTENIKFHYENGIRVEGDAPQYTFKAHLGPAAEYADNWKIYNNFKDDEHSTSIYAPAPLGKVKNVSISKSSETIAVDADNSSLDFMPPGAVTVDAEGNLITHSPVYYTQANEVVGQIVTDKVPIFDWVYDYTTPSLQVGVHNIAAGVTSQVDVKLNYNEGKAYTGWLHNLPMFNDDKAIESGYTKYMPLSSVRFQPSISAVYSNPHWDYDVYTNDRVSTADDRVARLDLSGHSKPTFTKTTRKASSGDMVITAYKIYEDGRADKDKWYAAAIVGIEQTPRETPLDGLHKVYGFHAPNVVDYTGGYLTPFSPTGHVAAPTFPRSEAKALGGGVQLLADYKYFSKDHEPDKSPVYYSASHDWAAITAANSYIPIVVDPVAGPFDAQPTTADFKNTEVDITLYEIYPVISHGLMFASSSKTETYTEYAARQNTRRRAPGTGSTSAITHNNIRPMGLAFNMKESLSGGQVTGVEDIVDSIDGEPIYYNIQGIRIETPQPGNVYIVRRGTTVTKEYYR